MAEMTTGDRIICDCYDQSFERRPEWAIEVAAEIDSALAERERATREACAVEIEPDEPRPCQSEFCVNGYGCDCGNVGNAIAAAGWDESTLNARAIRALGSTPSPLAPAKEE